MLTQGRGISTGGPGWALSIRPIPSEGSLQTGTKVFKMAYDLAEFTSRAPAIDIESGTKSLSPVIYNTFMVKVVSKGIELWWTEMM